MCYLCVFNTYLLQLLVAVVYKASFFHVYIWTYIKLLGELNDANWETQLSFILILFWLMYGDNHHNHYD